MRMRREKLEELELPRPHAQRVVLAPECTSVEIEHELWADGNRPRRERPHFPGEQGESAGNFLGVGVEIDGFIEAELDSSQPDLDGVVPAQ